MPLISCPQCNRKVSSVASTCPHCHRVLGEKFWEQGRRGDLVKCQKCRGEVAPDATVCRNCGTLNPTHRRLTWSPAAAAIVGIVAVIAIGVRSNSQTASLTGVGKPAPRTQASIQFSQVVTPTDSSPVTTTPDSVVPVRTTPAAVPPVTASAPEPDESAHDSNVGDDPVNPNQRWTADWANVRERRSVDAPVVLVLDPNEAILVDSLRGGWWAAYIGGRQVGYVSNSVLRQRPETP